MRILMVASELAPIVKVGSLADAVAGLAKTLSRLGVEVTIALPRHPAVDDSGLMLARRLTPLELRGGGMEATLFDARLAGGVELMFIDLPGVFGRAGVYGENGEPYADNARRYGLFCQAVASLVEKRGSEGAGWDVVHAHDWPAALVPHLLREHPVRTVLTIHDGSERGAFARAEAGDMGVDAGALPGWLSDSAELDMLSIGALDADLLTTVSPRYAEELSNPELSPLTVGRGLDAVLRERVERHGERKRLVGILDGIDYAIWSPSTDPHLVARYDAEDARPKGRCKASLLNELEMSIDPDRPLLVSVGPISERHGSDLLAAAIDGIVRTGAQLIVAGAGDRQLEKRIDQEVTRVASDAVYLGQVSDAMLHRLVAAADALVIPSRFEPCGLTQQYGQRYGAVPIARATGGLVDTVVDCDAHLETGTGFLFDEVEPSALLGAVARAVSAMRTPAWGNLRRRVMRLDRSWERPARQYLRHYQHLVE